MDVRRDMHVFDGYKDEKAPKGLILGIGNFDGVHLGHQAVIREVVRQARKKNTLPGLLTFDPHPLAVLAGGSPPPLIYTTEEKESILAGTGIEVLVRQPFDAAFAVLSPEEFVEEVLVAGLAPRGVVVGHDFRFGAGGVGDVGFLMAAGRRNGFSVKAVGEVIVSGIPVRSSRVRDLVARGEVAEAALLLGRPFHLSGEVVGGSGLGRKLGFPTANLGPPPKITPPAGVYAGEVVLDGREFPAAINIGLPGEEARGGLVECHLLDFAEDLYGRRISVRFHDRLREERRFYARADLSAQIARDVALTRTILKGRMK